MLTKGAIVVCFVLASLQLEVSGHHDADESSRLVLHTQEARRALDSAASHCSSGATELILSEESRVSELLGNCSKRVIFLHVSELLTDTSYFGFSLYDHASTLYTDWKRCSSQKHLFEKILCVVKRGPGAVKAGVELALSAVSYVLQLKNYVPKVVNEIKECRESAVTEYSQFLDGVVKKSVMC